jgi:hypothetical protein
LQNAEKACASWALAGECGKNPTFMHDRCPLACLRHICMTADFDALAHDGAAMLVAAVRRALDASRQPLPGADEAESCATDPDFDHEGLMTRLVETWQGGIPADAGCALTSGSMVYEAMGSGAGTPRQWIGPLQNLGLDLVAADVRKPGVLADASHLFMHPVCFSRGRMRDIMAAVRGAPAMRCMGSYRKPIELRRLNQTGFSLMCVADHAPSTTASKGSLFVYAKARSVKRRAVWPTKIPACDRSDIEPSA